MAKLAFNNLNYSREAGMFTVSGKGYLPIALRLREETGIDGVEHDADCEEYVFTYHKAHFDQDGIRELVKSTKKKVKEWRYS